MVNTSEKIEKFSSNPNADEIAVKRAVERYQVYLERIGLKILSETFRRKRDSDVQPPAQEGGKAQKVKTFTSRNHITAFYQPFYGQAMNVFQQESGNIVFETGHVKDSSSRFEIGATSFILKPDDDLYNEEGIQSILTEITFNLVTRNANIGNIFNIGKKPALELIRPQHDTFGLVDRLYSEIKELSGLEIPVLASKRPGLFERMRGKKPEIIDMARMLPALEAPQEKTPLDMTSEFKSVVEGINFEDSQTKDLAEDVVKIAEGAAKIYEIPRSNMLLSARARSSLTKTFSEMQMLTPVLEHADAEHQLIAIKALSDRFHEALEELGNASAQAAADEIAIVLSLREPRQQ